VKENKSESDSGITDVHLHNAMWIGTSKMEPNFKSVAEQRQAQFPY